MENFQKSGRNKQIFQKKSGRGILVHTEVSVLVMVTIKWWLSKKRCKWQCVTGDAEGRKAGPWMGSICKVLSLHSHSSGFGLKWDAAIVSSSLTGCTTMLAPYWHFFPVILRTNSQQPSYWNKSGLQSLKFTGKAINLILGCWCWETAGIFFFLPISRRRNKGTWNLHLQLTL